MDQEFLRRMAYTYDNTPMRFKGQLSHTVDVNIVKLEDHAEV